ncbi:MAG: hypothetical protein DRG78_15875 [Epsilonproteobacteria bacterium]|nr:MAG: hypothetical protein DRG78_15875 [Campylobacterota bacterium]
MTTQNNIFGKNELNIIYKISIDVERLQDIVYNDSKNIQRLLSTLTDDDLPNATDNSSLNIKDKNIKNELVDFYNEWIKKEESKFKIIEEFIVNNNLYEIIDKASTNLRQVIYTYQNKNNHQLTSELFTTLIQEHTKGLTSDDKDIMTLLLYFLYRECFIGDK